MQSSLTNPARRIQKVIFAVWLACSGVLNFSADAQDSALPQAPATSSATNVEPPLSWIDPDTGHRVIRLTREPGSDSFYFNYNCFTADGKKMAYLTTNGISVLNL